MIFPFLLLGLAAATFVPNALPRFVAGRIGASFLLGVGTNGAVLFILGTCGVPLKPLTFALIPLLALVVFAVRWRHLRGTTWSGDMHEVASTIAILVPFLILIWTSSIIPLADYDGRTTWMPKAHAIADETSIHGPFFQGERGLNLHNRYPLLMPLNAAALAAFHGDVRALYVLIAPAFLLAVRDLLTPRFGTPLTSWCIATLAWLPQIVVAPEGGAASAYSDLAVAAFFGMAVASRVALDDRGIGAAALWCSFLVLTKNEGVLLTVAIVSYRPRLRLLVAPALALAVLLAWQHSVPDAYDERNARLLIALPQQIGRIHDAALAIARRAVDLGVWGVLWPLVLLAAVIRRDPPAALIPLCLALAGYIAVLACTSWDIEQLASVSAHRLLLHCVIPAACVVIAGLQRGISMTTPLSSRVA